MENERMLNEQAKAKSENKGGIELTSNDCYECKEGCVFGDCVYCSIDA